MSEESKLKRQNDIYRNALDRIWRGADTPLGMGAREIVAIFQSTAHNAMVMANQVTDAEPEVEYWIEFGPNSWSPIKAPNKQWGLRFINENRHNGSVRLAPRRKVAVGTLYPPVPAEPPQPHRTVTLENGQKVCPDCQQGMAAAQQPTGEQ